MEESEQTIVEAIEELQAAAKRNGSISRTMLSRVSEDYGIRTAVLEKRFETLVGKAWHEYRFAKGNEKKQQKLAVFRAQEIRSLNQHDYCQRYFKLHDSIATNGRTWLVYVGSFESETGFTHQFINSNLMTELLEWGDLHESYPGFIQKLFEC